MVEKIVFIVMMVVAVVGGVVGCFYELGGTKRTPEEKDTAGEKESVEL